MEAHGVVPPLCTPLTSDGEIDTDALRTYTEFLETEGVHGLFPCGTTGEFASLTDEQAADVIETVSDARESIPVFAGCGHTSVEQVLEQIDTAAAAGADAAVVVTPYYMPATVEGMEAFLSRVADSASLPVFLYNVPSLTNYELSVEEVVTLSKHDRIVGLKDTTGDLLRFYDLLERTPDSFSVFQGDGTLALPSLGMGASGVIAGSANIVPGVMSQLFDSYEAGEIGHAHELMQRVVYPLIQLFNQYPQLPSIKFLVGRVSADMGEPLPPLPKLTSRQKRDLEEGLAALQRTTTSVLAD